MIYIWHTIVYLTGLITIGCVLGGLLSKIIIKVSGLGAAHKQATEARDAAKAVLEQSKANLLRIQGERIEATRP